MGPNRPLRSLSQQPGAVARAPPQVPTTGSQLGRVTMPAIPFPKHSHFLKVSSDSGSPRELGTSCQVLPKLPFTRTKSEPNSRGLIGKHQRRPPSVDTTSINKRNRTPQMPRQQCPTDPPCQRPRRKSCSPGVQSAFPTSHPARSQTEKSQTPTSRARTALPPPPPLVR